MHVEETPTTQALRAISQSELNGSFRYSLLFVKHVDFRHFVAIFHCARNVYACCVDFSENCVHAVKMRLRFVDDKELA